MTPDPVPRPDPFPSHATTDRRRPAEGTSDRQRCPHHADTDDSPPTAFRMGKAPGGLPVLGHTLALVRNPLGFMTSLPALGDLVRIGFGPIKAIVICHPDLIRQVLVDDRAFDKEGLMWDRFAEVVGDGVINAPRSRHRRLRRLIQPAFHPARLPDYAAVMSRQIAVMTDSWRDGQIIDVPAAMEALTSRVAARTMVAAPVDDQLVAELRDVVPVLVHGAYRRMLTPAPLDRLPTPGKRRYDHAIATLRRITRRFIEDYRSAGIDHGDVLSMLLAARSEQDRPLGDTEICDQVSAIFGAGSEASATTLSWALHLLASHPDVQRRLCREADGVLAGRTATWDDLVNLTYTREVVTETLRLYPPIWMVPRTATTDTELGGHLIAAGTVVICCAYLLHHRPDLYDNPEQFTPERWTGLTTDPPGPFPAFGHGARRCIGDNFGLVEVTLTLASIAARWQVHALPGHQAVRPQAKIILIPHELRLRLTRRTDRTTPPHRDDEPTDESWSVP